MTIRARLGFAVYFGSAAVCGLASVPAAARVADVKLAAQPLDQALRSVARQTGTNILFAAEVVRGLRAPALKGEFTGPGAVERLLRRSGLGFEVNPDETILIRRISDAGVVRRMSGTVPPLHFAKVPTVQVASVQLEPRSGPSPSTSVEPSAPAGPSPADPRFTDQDDVIIVTARKRTELLSDVPLSVTAVSGDRLVQLGISGPADLEKVALGFTYRPSAQGSPIFQIRGIGFFEEAIGVAPTVSVYLDQAPLPFSSMAEGVAFDLERVEVLKGPQGTLFGQNVTGGAVNYIAAKPTRTFRAGLDAGYGRFDAIDIGGFVSGPLSSTLRARIAGRIERRDDWQRTYTRVNAAGFHVVDTDAPYRSLGKRRFGNGRMLLNWTPTERLDLLLNVNGWRNRSDSQAQRFHAAVPDTPGNVGSVPFWPQFSTFPRPPRDNRYADWDPDRSFRRDDSFYQGSLRGEYALTDAVAMTSITSYSDLDVARPVDNDGTPFPAAYIINRGQLKAFSQELRLAGALANERLRWMVGGNYANDRSHEVQDIFLNLTNTLPFFTGAAQDMKSKARTWSGFASLDYKLAKTVNAQAALRYTKQKRNMLGCTRDLGDGTFGNFISLVFGLPPIAPGACTTLDLTTFTTGPVRDTFSEDNFAWRVGLDWKPVPDLMVYANATKGYKAGNFVNITAVFANSLEPIPQEELLSYEAGLKFSGWQRRLQLSGAAFYYDYKDKQLTGFRDSGIIGTINSVVSVPKSRIFGGEAEAIVRPFTGLTLRGGATYINSKVTDDFLALDSGGTAFNRKGESFPGTPKWAAIADAEYEFPLQSRWTGFVGGNAGYRSKSRTFFGNDPLYDIPGYTLVDLRAGIRTGDDRYRVQIYGRNIFDKYYVVTAQGQGDNVTHITGMPATYGVTLSARY